VVTPIVGVLAAAFLTGCQTYKRVPLDLADHRAVIDARSGDADSIRRFIDRLESTDGMAARDFDLTDGVSDAEAEVLALFYNADLHRARLEADVALATYETAGLWEDPEFGFDGAEVLSPGGPFNYGLTLSLTIPISGRLAVAKDRAGAAYEAELRRIVDAEWSTRAAVRSAWAAWSVEVERAKLLGDVLEQVERIGKITDRLELAGELSGVGARLSRAELVSLRVRRIAAERAAATARIRLLGLMGLAPNASIDLQPSVVGPQARLVADDAQRLIEANTMVAVRRAEYQVAEQTLRLEIREQFPDITIGSGFGREDRENRLLLGVSVPVPILNANRGPIAEAAAQRESAREAAEASFEQVRRELALARAEVDAARRQVAAFADQLVPMLEEQTREVQRLTELGEIDTLLLLETVTRDFEARSTLLDLQLAQVQAAIDVARLLGPNDVLSPAPVRDNDGNPSPGNGDEETTP
jgi:cobalt-zinc-cadmium efflux system outer membrane protein